VKLHAIVDELVTAERAVEGGATVIQLRLKDVPTAELVQRGRSFQELCVRTGTTFVVNDDVEAARQLGAEGVHLGRNDTGAVRALTLGLMLGLSAASLPEAEDAERRGASYIGAGPVWATPSKPDADPPFGLEGLKEICAAVSIPVVAIGGIDAGNAAACTSAGAVGVAVVRAAAGAGVLLRALGDGATV
jgi:thiamine-phosphate pyrophosphorylase